MRVNKRRNKRKVAVGPDTRESYLIAGIFLGGGGKGGGGVEGFI